MRSINTREFKSIIEFTIKSGLKQPILGLGAPGIGKSEIIQQIGRELGYHVEDLRLAQMSEVELCGLIYPNETRTETTWLIPDWFPKEGGPKTILLLDEITSATKRVQVAAYQLVLDRRLGRHFLPDDTVIIALGNGEDDGGVYEELAAPLANRFEIYNVQMDAKVWVEDYARVYRGKDGKGVNPLVTSYIESHPTSLHTQSENEDEIVFASPRTWKRVSDTLNVAGDINSTIVMNKICACVGETLGYEFYKYAKLFANEQTAEEVIAGENPAVPTDAATRQFVVESIISIYSNVCKSDEFDMDVRVLAHNNISKWAHQLSAEVEASLVQAISSVDPEVTQRALLADASSVSDLASTLSDVYSNTTPDVLAPQPESVQQSGVFAGISQQSTQQLVQPSNTAPQPAQQPQVAQQAVESVDDIFSGLTII